MTTGQCDILNFPRKPFKMQSETQKAVKEKVPCEECDKTFTSKVDMKLHLESQHLGILHTCDHCFHSFKLEKMLKRHIRLAHPTVQFKCQKCPKKYLLEYLLEHHVKAAHLWTILNCPKCGETMTNKDQLESHQCGNKTNENIRKESEDEKMCEFCGKDIEIQNFDTHVKACEALYHSKFHNLQYQCSGCKRSYSRKFQLRDHYRTNHQKKKFKCTQCTEEFAQKRSLKEHMNSQHLGIFLKCHLCGKNFNTNTALVHHIQADHEKLRHNCDQCHKEFKSKGSLQLHIKNTHLEPKKKGNRCEKCGEPGSKPGLYIHLCGFEDDDPKDQTYSPVPAKKPRIAVNGRRARKQINYRLLDESGIVEEHDDDMEVYESNDIDEDTIETEPGPEAFV